MTEKILQAGRESRVPGARGWLLTLHPHPGSKGEKREWGRAPLVIHFLL